MEQCSSEATARYKEGLPPSLTGRAEEGLGQGGSFVDLTGGFGVDFSYMSRGFQRRVYVERDEGLCKIARENFRRLGLEAEVVCGDGVEYLRQMERVDVIFLDPARRDSHGQRTYAVSDCTPDVTAIQGLLREKARRVIIKLSPMLDWRQVTRELEGVTEVHIVATGGECKELVVVMEAEGDGGCDRVATYTTPQVVCAGLRVICADLEGDCWVVPERTEAGLLRRYASPEAGMVLHVPNAAVMKAGCFDELAAAFGVMPVAANSHLFVASEAMEGFPGRSFHIEAVTTMNKKELRRTLAGIRQANISVRNFPLTADELRKRLKIKDGGECFLFATTTAGGQHIVVVARR